MKLSKIVELYTQGWRCEGIDITGYTLLKKGDKNCLYDEKDDRVIVIYEDDYRDKKRLIKY
jgi:hypothetical protein